MGSMRKRKYNGCELSSPLYRQIAAEMAKKKIKVHYIYFCPKSSTVSFASLRDIAKNSRSFDIL